MAYPDQKNLVAQRTYYEKYRDDVKAQIDTRLTKNPKDSFVANTLKPLLARIEAQLVQINAQLHPTS